MLYAVLIGVDQVAGPGYPKVVWAPSGVQALGSVLKERLATEWQMTLLANERATKPRITRVITEELPRQVKRSDVVLLHFACRGFNEVSSTTSDGAYKLALHDTNVTSLSKTAIDVMSELGPWMQGLQARLILLVLDVAFGARAGVNVDGSMPPPRSLPPPSRRETRGLADRLRLPPNGVLLHGSVDDDSSRPGSSSADSNNGIMTGRLVEVLSRAPSGTPITPQFLHDETARLGKAGSGAASMIRGAQARGTLLHLREPGAAQEPATAL